VTGARPSFADDELRHGFAQRIGGDERTLADTPVLDPARTAQTDVERVLWAEEIPQNVRVSGHVYDVKTGLVTSVVDAKAGSKEPQAAVSTRSLTGSWSLALELAADRMYRVAATDAMQIPSAITRTVPSLGHGHRWVSCSRRVTLCVTTFSDRYATTAVARTAAVSATAWTTCTPAGRITGFWAMVQALLRRRRRYLLTTRLTAASANAITPVVSVRSHGSTGQYGLASDAPPKMATRHVLAQHSREV
jgi:hypothetical protein